LLQCRVKVRFCEQVKFVHLALLGNSIAIKAVGGGVGTFFKI
jgi:hypothetical protein